jgi:predicted DNA-binding mobile mystery protein A
VELEQSERKGTIALATLRRVAAALDCTVVYALVPNKPLEVMVRDRAHAVVRQRRAAVEHSMLLEDQAVEPDDSAAQLDEFVRSIDPGRLWDDR